MSINRTKVATIALVLMLTAAAMIMTLPTVNAHTPAWSIKTYAYITAAPDPVGLGQTIFINMFIHLAPPTAGGTYQGSVIGDRWENFKVTVTAPDHHQTVLGPFTSDATGGTYTTFVPDQLGEYSFEFNFPGQTLTGGPPQNLGRVSAYAQTFIGDYFQPSSATATVTVQQEKVVQYPDTPLPTGYWQRPIYSMNTLWSTIGGNWYGYRTTNFHTTGLYNYTGNFAPYTTAPTSAHIVWTRPMKFGGQIGGEFGGDQTTQFVSTSQYQPFYGPIIIAGRLYYQERPGSSSNPTGWNCINIKTGELIWHKNITDPLLFGQILNYASMNQYGAYAYLWSQRPTVAPNIGSTYGIYDAWTGDWICDVVNMTVGATGVVAAQTPGLNFMIDTRTCPGSILAYYNDPTDNTLTLWNSTRAIMTAVSGDPNGQFYSLPQYGKIPFKPGIVWKMPRITNFTGTYPNGRPINLFINTMTPDVIQMRYDPQGTALMPQLGWIIEAGYSARDGRLLWGPINRTLPAFNYLSLCQALNGVYAIYLRDTFEWRGYSITTGDLLWGPKVFPHNAWDKYGIAPTPAYGNIYAVGFGGYVNCIDAKTGDLKWTYFTGGSGYDTPYGVWTLWTFARQTVADGKLYAGMGHEYSPPLFRGAQEICLDAFSGKLLWSVLGFYAEGPPAIADGVMLVDNAYDMNLYAFSKGQTATTVTAPLTTVANGSSVFIQGTVTDQSPGAKGTPAIADAYMKPWMEYLYMQQPIPMNCTGVPVQLQATGSDGTIIDIGTVTSDGFGNFKTTWTPTKPDVYTILATFAGSESYYASSASTGAAVGPSPAAPTPAAEAVAPDYTPMFAGIIVAVAVAIGIGLLNLFWKRK